MVAHNALFERLCWRWIRRTLKPYWPDIPISQWDCTLARCAALALPLGLEMACDVLQTSHRKDTEGGSLMMRMAKPRKVWPCATCFGVGCSQCIAGQVYEWNDDPEKVARLGLYCDDDVLAEIGLDNTLLPLSDRERRVWELDQTINDRGIRLDVPLIERCIAIIDAATTGLNAEMSRLTGGAVPKVSSVAKLVAWITAQGVPCESVAKGEQDELLLKARTDNLPHVEYAIELRQQAKSSTAKYRAALDCAGADDRARGLKQYHGASTGRWAGRLLQPDNLYRVDAERDGADIEHAVDLVESFTDPVDALAALDVVLTSVDQKKGTLLNAPMVMLAKCIRSMLIPAPGKRFVGGDSSNIEGRVNAWLAGAEWKLEAFRRADADPTNKALDLYNRSYCASFGGDPAKVKGVPRQIGKVMELALGFQGSIMAFISMAKNYGVHPRDVAPIVKAFASAETWSAARERYYWRGVNRYDLPEDEWVALRIIVNGYRTENPEIVQGWWDLQDAAIAAVTEPGALVPAYEGRVRYLSARGFLWCSLPSRRLLAYFNPRIVETDDSYFLFPDDSRCAKASLTMPEQLQALASGAKLVDRFRKRVDYDGYDGEKRRWSTFNLYGGLQCENIVQATARDLLVEFMFEAEDKGYPIVLTVHDELLTEMLFGFGSPEELRDIMQHVPIWAEGLPLAAKTWEGRRYDK